jgi:hypothetical protein
MVAMTIDDEIATARGQAETLEAELAARRDAAAAAQAELDQLDAREPEERSGRQGEHMARWDRERQAAQRRHSKAIDGLEGLARRLAEATGWALQLEGRRVPKFDDAIAEARARLAEIPRPIAARAAEARTLEARLRGFDVAEAVDDPIPAGEPAATSAKLVTVRAAIADLEAERSRLDLRVATLLERRQSAVVEIVDVERQRIAERWAALAGEALEAATRLHAIALELERLEEAHRASGARHGLPSGGFATVDDQRFNPADLERRIVHVARGLALR